MPTNALLKTNVSGTWNSSTGLSYSQIPTISGIAHKDQLEVERIFTVPSGTILTQEDFRKIYIIASNNYTVDETNKKITAFSASFPSYTTVGGVTITVPAITNGAAISIRRKSITSEALVSWVDGTRLTASQLNLQTSQLISVVQEILDRMNYEFVTATDLDYNFGYKWSTRTWVEGRLGAISTDVKTYIDAADTNLQNQITAAVGVNTTQNGRLDAIESLNTSQTSSINTLNTRVSPSTSLTGTYSASNLSAAVNGLDTRVTSVESTNTTQGNNITALQSKVDVSTALSNSYVSLTAGVNDLHSRVSATEATNTTQTSNISALQTKVGAGTVTGTIVANGSDIITAVNAIDDYVTNAVTTSTNTIFNGHAQGRIVYAGANGTKDSTANFTITPSGTSPTVLTLAGNLSQTGNITQTGNTNITGNLTQTSGTLSLTGNAGSLLSLTGTITLNAGTGTVPTITGAASQKIIAFKNSSAVEVNAIDQYGNLTGRATATYGSSSPTNPIAGTIWYDSANTAFKIYNGSAWTQISTTTLANYVGLSGNETVAGNKTFSGDTVLGNGTATLPLKVNRTTNGNIAEFWETDGTNNPRLVISADSAVGITLQETYSNAANNLIFKIGSTEAARFNGLNFGIGTTAPKAKLDVSTAYTGTFTTKKLYKTWKQVPNSHGHTSYSHCYLKLFRLPEAIADSWNNTAFTICGTMMVNRGNDLGITTSQYLYISKAYSTTGYSAALLEGCVHYGYIGFEPTQGSQETLQLVKVNDGGVDWVCLYYYSTGANIDVWTFDGVLHFNDAAISDNKHCFDLADPTLILGPTLTGGPLPTSVLHTTLAYTGRRVELGDFAGTAMSIGSGEDASSFGSAPLIVTNDGVTNLAIRDSTNDVELINCVNSTGGFIGSYTNHPLEIRTNNTSKIRVETSGQVEIGASAIANTQSTTNLSVRGGASGNGLEWGHSNQAGYNNTLGQLTGNGGGFIAFSAEHGTNANTFRTRGIKGAGIVSDNNGGLYLGTLATASADNQTMDYRARLFNNGDFAIDTSTLFVDATNHRVGINTASPSTTLEVSGPTKLVQNATTLYLYGTDHSYLSFYPRGQAEGRKAYIGFGGASTTNLTISNEDTGAIHILNGAATRLSIANNGNTEIDGTTFFVDAVNNRIGMGTTAPTDELNINTADDVITKLSGYGGTHRSYWGVNSVSPWIGTETAHDFRLITNATEKMRISSSGLVGIGGASTGTKLEVMCTGTGSDGINIKNTGNSAYGSLHIQGTTGGVGSWANGFVIEGVPASTGNTILSSYNNSLVFQTGTSRTQRMSIDSTGIISIAGPTTFNDNVTIASTKKLVTPTVQTDVIQSTGTLEFRGDYDATGGTTADMTINASGVVVFNQPPLYGAVPLSYPETEVFAQAAGASTGFRFNTNYTQHDPANFPQTRYIKQGRFVTVSGAIKATTTRAHSETEYQLLGLPAPAQLVCGLATGVVFANSVHSHNTCLLKIDTSGRLYFTQLQTGQTTQVLPSIRTDTWLTFNITYMTAA
jgi:hypothetical protein